ncbi:MAG: 3-phosphoshikimate 1-carboxyvinyltransferase [Deltaproteobacteria bacterium]
MFYEVKPAENFKCTVSVPGSKSITNRALIIGALAGSGTILNNFLYSDDTVYMLEALRGLGYRISDDKDAGTVIIHNPAQATLKGSCFVGNSGTAIRFLASFCAAAGCEVELTGIERMKERPIGELAEALKALGAEIAFKEKEGFPPIRIKSNGLEGGKVSIRGDISSQFITSLLLSAPYAKNDIEIEIQGELVSKPYVDITIQMMKDFGVEVKNYNYKHFLIKAGQSYTPREYTIESDCSSASYFFAAAAIANGDVTVENINPKSLQGDIKFVDILEEMGAMVERGDNYIRVIGKELKGITIDMQNTSDVAQTLAVAALFAEGPTEIKNVYNMRLKETDRLRAVANELVKLGAGVEEKKDGITIYPASSYKAAEIETYDDHRMAMSFTLAGLKIPGIRIANPGCVSKTFPQYFNEFQKIYG